MLAVVAIAFAGCGGDAAPATSGATAPQPAATTSSSAAPTPASKRDPQRVAIKDFDYAPGKLEVAVGTKVTWKNEDSANHTVTFDSGSEKTLGNQAKGASVTMNFTKAGTFAYHCDYHPNMHGMVVVR